MIMAAAAAAVAVAAAPHPPPSSPGPASPPAAASKTTDSSSLPYSPQTSPSMLLLPDCHPSTVHESEDDHHDEPEVEEEDQPHPLPLVPSACSAHQALATLLSPPRPLAMMGQPLSPSPVSFSSSSSYSFSLDRHMLHCPGEPPSLCCDHGPLPLSLPPPPRPRSALSTARSSLQPSLIPHVDHSTQVLAAQVFTTPAIANALVRAMQSNDAVLFPYLTLSRALYHAIVQAWWVRMDLKNPWALDLVAQRLVAHTAQADIEAAMDQQPPPTRGQESACEGSPSSTAGSSPARRTDENVCVQPTEDSAGLLGLPDPLDAAKPMSPVLSLSDPVSDASLDSLLTASDLAHGEDFVEDEDAAPAAAAAAAGPCQDPIENVGDSSIQDVSMLNLSAYLALPPLRIPDPVADDLAHLATTTRHVSLTGIKSYAHASRHAPGSATPAAAARFVLSDAMPAATYLLSRTPLLTSLHLDLAMIPSSVTVAHALDALPRLRHLHLRDTSPAGVPLSGKLVYSVFGHPALHSLDLVHVHVLHSLEIHARLAPKNADRPLDRSPLRRLSLVTDRFALVGPLADHLRSLVFLLDVLPHLAHVHVRAANIPQMLLDALANTHRPEDDKPGVTHLELDLPARAELPIRWTPVRLLPLGAGRLDAPGFVPHIRHLTVRALGPLPRPLPHLLSSLPLLESLTLAATNNSIFLLTDTLAAHPRLHSLALHGDIEPGTLPLLGLPATPRSGLAHLHLHGDQPLCTLALMRLAANLGRDQLKGLTLLAGTFLAADPIGAPLRPIPAWLVAWVCKWQANLANVALRVRNHADDVDLVAHALATAVCPGGKIYLVLARCGDEGTCACMTRAQLRARLVRVLPGRHVRVLDVHRCPPGVPPAVVEDSPTLTPAPVVASPAAASGATGRKRKRTDAANPGPPPGPPNGLPPPPGTPTKADDQGDDEDGLGTPRKRIGLTPLRGGTGTPRAVAVATPAKAPAAARARVRKVEWGQVKVVEVDKWIEDVVDEW